MKTTFAVMASAILVCCAPAFAQSAAPLPSADPQVVAAAREMMTTMKIRDTLVTAMGQIEQRMPEQAKASATMAIKMNPKLSDEQKAQALAKFEHDLPAMRARMHALLSDPTLIDDMLAEMAPLYAETFTIDEIRQLTAFYSSPVGQKTLAVMPTLMSRGMEIGGRVMAPRVQKMMAQATQVSQGGAGQ